MDGMPLYEYARKGLPLPRPIEGRAVTVHALALEAWIAPGAHGYTFPEKRQTEEQRENARRAFEGAKVAAPGTQDDIVHTVHDDAPEVDEGPGPALVLRMTVSGGTYVRSIVHDLARAVGTAAHVVTLTRTRQGAYFLDERASSGEATAEGVSPARIDGTSNQESLTAESAGLGATAGEDSAPGSSAGTGEDAAAVADESHPAVPWALIEHALEQRKTDAEPERDADGWTEWERVVLDSMGMVEARKKQ